MKTKKDQRLAWALTGSGHFLKESLEIARSLPDVDLFLTRAAEEVLQMYDLPVESLRSHFRVMRDNTASAVTGISDTLATNMYAQAGKCRIPSIVFACDTEPVVTTEAPGEWVTLYPRR